MDVMGVCRRKRRRKRREDLREEFRSIFDELLERSRAFVILD